MKMGSKFLYNKFSYVFNQTAIALLVTTFLVPPVFAGAGSDSISLPPLATDQDKLAFLIEVKHRIPKLFSDAAQYDIDLLSLLGDEEKLLHQLKSNPEYVKEFEQKSYDELTITPPQGGLEIVSKKIKPEAVQQWKDQLSQTLSEVKNGNEKNSPKAVLESQIQQAISDLGDRKEPPSKEFGKLLGKFQANPNIRAIYNEKIGSVKDLDTLERLKLLLNHYNEFPSPPVPRTEIEGALSSISKFEELKNRLALHTILTRPAQGGQVEGAGHSSFQSWEAADLSLKQVNKDDLIFFHDKEDALAPRIKEVFEQNLAHPAKNLENLLLGEVHKNIDSFARQTESAPQRATEKITLTQVPPAVGIFRGCTGGDCSSQYSFPYPNDPKERVFFVKDKNGNPKGYVSATEVMAGGEPSLYVITISGNRISAADTEMILRALDHEKSKLGVKSISLPETSKVGSLINFPEPRSVYDKYTTGKSTVPIHYQNPQIRKIIEGYESADDYNTGDYDHMANNEKAVLLKFPEKETKDLSIQHQKIQETIIHPHPISNTSTSDVLEFLLELHNSKRDYLLEKLTRLPEVQSKINFKQFSHLTHLLDTVKDEHGRPLSVKEFQQQVESSLNGMNIKPNYIKTHNHLLYPGRVHCSDAFSKENIDETAEQIVKDMKESDDFLPKKISLGNLSESDRDNLYKTNIFTKRIQTLAQEIKNLDPTVRRGALGTLGYIRPTNAAIHHSIAGALQDSDPHVRLAAMDALESVGSTNTTIHHSVVGVLHDSDESVRWVALRFLCRTNTTDPSIQSAIQHGIQHIAVRALRDSDPSVRNRAENKLHGFMVSNPQNFHAIAEVLKDPNPPVRKTALRVLQHLNATDPPTQQAIQHAIVGALQDSDPDVHEAAASALVKVIKFADRETLHAIAEVFKDPNPRVRKAACDLSAVNTTDPSLQQAIQHAIVGALQDSDPDVRESAVYGLPKIKLADPITLILRPLKNDPHPRVRAVAAHALVEASTTDPSIQQVIQHALLGALQDSDPSVRASTLGALARSKPGDPMTHHAIAAALQDSNLTVRRCAAIALREISPKDPAIHRALAEGIKDSDFWVRTNAADALLRVKPADLTTLRALLDQIKNPSRRSHADRPHSEDLAAKILADIKPADPSFRHEVLEVLKFPQAQDNALKVLSGMKPSDLSSHLAIAEVINGDRNYSAREKAVDILIDVKPPDSSVHRALANMLPQNPREISITKETSIPYQAHRALKEIVPLISDAKTYLLILEAGYHDLLESTEKDLVVRSKLIHNLILEARHSDEMEKDNILRALDRLHVDKAEVALLKEKAAHESEACRAQGKISSFGRGLDTLSEFLKTLDKTTQHTDLQSAFSVK